MQTANHVAQRELTPVILGRITAVFGVKGWVKVRSYTEPQASILDYERWLLGRGDAWNAAELEEGKVHGKSLIAKLAQVGDRDAAAELIDLNIAVPRDQLPETEKDEYYWADLEGLQVVHRDGSELGKVAYLIATGANDVLVVQGDRERLIPFVMGVVILEVDLAAGTIRVDWDWD